MVRPEWPECFSTAWEAHIKRQCSAKDYAELIVRHLSGLRHSDPKNASSAWAYHSMVTKASKLCMRDPEWSIAPDLMTQMLIESAYPSTTWASLKELDIADTVLTHPLAVQLLTAFSMVHRNKTLAKSLIRSLPSPPPHSHDVFGALGSVDPIWTSRLDAYHPCLPGNSACDVWTVLLDAGWVHAYQLMLYWAASYRKPDNADADGLALAEALLARGVTVDKKVLKVAIHRGSCEMIKLCLQHYRPSTPKEEHDLLCYAAERKSDVSPPVSDVFQTLFDNGFRDINWMDPGEHKKHILGMPADDQMAMLYESLDWTPQLTLLHAAVRRGSPETIEWLISQGATIQKDGWGRNPLDLAMTISCDDGIEEVLKRLGVEETPEGEEIDAEDLIWTTWQAHKAEQAARREDDLKL